MTNKKIKLFLVFICLFFISFSSVKADDTSSNFSLDFTSIDSNILNSTYIDEETHSSYTLRDILDLVIDRYSKDYKFMIFVDSDYRNDIFEFYIFKINSSLSDTDLFFHLDYNSREDFHVLRLGSSNTLISKQFIYKNYTQTGGGLANSIFSLNRLYSDIDNFMSSDNYNSTLINTVDNFDLLSRGVIGSKFPYYINFNTYYKDSSSSDIIVRKSSARQIIISNGDSMTPFFLTSSANDLNNEAPVPNITFSDVVTDDNNIVTSVIAHISFSDYLGSYRNFYAIDNNWLSIDSDTSFTITSNILLSARSCSKTSDVCYNKKIYNIDFIGKDKKFFDDFMEKIYLDSLIGEEPVLSASSGVEDYIDWYVYSLKKTYPIIFQLKDLISCFNPDTSSGIHDNQPLPTFDIDLSFIGINQRINIFDLSVLLPYRNEIYTFIECICVLYTFIAVVDLVKEASSIK